MLPDIYTQTLVDNRRSLIAWSVGTAAVGLMYAAFYPQVSAGGMADAVSSYPEAMREALRLNDMTSAAGYLGSSVFGLLQNTLDSGRRELQLVQSQDVIADPPREFEVRAVG